MLLICLGCWVVRVEGQDFSSDLDYTKFYDGHFDPRFELQLEPTIALWWINSESGGVCRGTFGILRILRKRAVSLLGSEMLKLQLPELQILLLAYFSLSS